MICEKGNENFSLNSTFSTEGFRKSTNATDEEISKAQKALIFPCTNEILQNEKGK